MPKRASAGYSPVKNEALVNVLFRIMSFKACKLIQPMAHFSVNPLTSLWLSFILPLKTLLGCLFGSAGDGHDTT